MTYLYTSVSTISIMNSIQFYFEKQVLSIFCWSVVPMICIAWFCCYVLSLFESLLAILWLSLNYSILCVLICCFECHYELSTKEVTDNHVFNFGNCSFIQSFVVIFYYYWIMVYKNFRILFGNFTHDYTYHQI